MTETAWADVDRYLSDLYQWDDPVLREALDRAASAGLRPIHVPASQGKFLKLLAEMIAARDILEVGTLAAYSTIWLARGLAPGGRLVTIERDESSAAVARANLTSAGLSDVVDLRVAPAAEEIGRLARESRLFDLVFLDADRPHYPDLFAAILSVSKVGTVIVADNVIRAGAVREAEQTDPGVQGVRHFHVTVAQHPRVSAAVLQTVGHKGHDGFSVMRVVA